MHWPLAISRKIDALRAAVAAIGALLAGHDQFIARSLRNAAFAMLRPAEAAARRLIVIAARGLVLAAPVTRHFAFAGQARAAVGARIPAFRLFDPKARFPRLVRVAPAGIPRIRTFWGAPPAPPPRRRRPGHPSPRRPSGPRACGFASPRSKRRSPTCRARRGGWRAGGPAGKPATPIEAERFRPRRCAWADRRAGVRRPSSRSTMSCATVMRSRSIAWLPMRGPRSDTS